MESILEILHGHMAPDSWPLHPRSSPLRPDPRMAMTGISWSSKTADRQVFSNAYRHLVRFETLEARLVGSGRN